MAATYNQAVGGDEHHPERLRDLAMLRAQGRLTQDAFRTRRREFIDAVLTGEKTLYPSSTAPGPRKPRPASRQDTVNLPILVATACIIALLTLGSLYLIRDKGSPHDILDVETVAEE